MDYGKAYLGLDVVEGWWGDDREADEEDVGLWIGEWAETVVIFLSGSIPKSERNWLSIDHHRGGVVVEAGRQLVYETLDSLDRGSRYLHSWDILSWERVGGIGDQQAGLSQCQQSSYDVT